MSFQSKEKFPPALSWKGVGEQKFLAVELKAASGK